MDASSWNYRNDCTRAISAGGPMVLLILISIFVAGCGGGSSSSSQPTSPGLWVANRIPNSVTGFSAGARKHSGTPAATFSNSSTELNDPEGLIFDKHHNMWVANCAGSDDLFGSITEFTQGQLGKLKQDPAPGPAVELMDDGSGAVFNCPYGLEFDQSGNLWVSNRFTPELISFSPDQLQQSGVQPPDTTIFSTHFGGPEDLLFDKEGTLWIADAAVASVFGYKSATLAAALGQTVEVDPDIINSSAALNLPDALAFDRDGNQWVANCNNNNLVRFNAADIAMSGAPTPEITLTSTAVTTASGTAESLDCPEGITFDPSGNLWVSNAISDTFGSLAKFTPSQLAASGSPAPAVFLDADSMGDNLNQPVLIDFGPP